MKITILSVLVSSLGLFLLASCSSGISQEQYKKATDDLAAAQTQVKTLQTQTQTLQTQNQTLQTQIQALQSQLQSLQSQAQPSPADKAALADLQQKINQAKPYWALMTSFYQIGITGQTPGVAQMMDMMGKVQALNDATLTAKMQALVSTGMGAKEVQDIASYLMSKIDTVLK